MKTEDRIDGDLSWCKPKFSLFFHLAIVTKSGYSFLFQGGGQKWKNQNFAGNPLW